MGNTAECKLLQGWFAVLIQGLLAILAFSVLIVKRYREKPRRLVIIWCMDVSKQIASTGAAHICGMVIAILASHTSSSSASECAWYFVAFTFDTTIGVLITVGLHRVVLALAGVLSKRFPKSNILAATQKCGYYGDPPSYLWWFIQLVEWTLCVVLARACVGGLIIAANSFLIKIAIALDSLFEGKPQLLLTFVMVACPLGMNMLQALVQDYVLKWNKPKPLEVKDISSGSEWDDCDSGDELLPNQMHPYAAKQSPVPL